MKHLAIILSAAILLSTGTATVLAHDHDHSHEAAGPARLALNNGQKWATDDNLRLGMSRIRNALAAALPAIRTGSANAAQYQTLARQANDQIAFMVQNCKLDRDTDAMLHLILADIIAGADAMTERDPGAGRAGAEKLMHALDNYGTYFDHPGWQGINSH